MADSHTDRQADNDAGRWMSYAQLAEIRGISKKAAQRLTLRHQWRRQPANDGGVLIWVPDDAGPPEADRQADRTGGLTDLTLSPFSRTRTDAPTRPTSGRMPRWRWPTGSGPNSLMRAGRACRGAGGGAATRPRRRPGHRRRSTARRSGGAAEAQKAQEAAEALRKAEEARKARGRLRRAWDGWRGR